MIKKGELYFPSAKTKEKAILRDEKIYQEAERDPVAFWSKLAKELFWFKEWEKDFEENPPYFKWFLEGKINITSNIFEKNKLGWEKIKEKTALIWEPEPTTEEPKSYTYEELLKLVNGFANALKALGVKKGDVVGIYLPMIPETIISMLACARIGAIHAVVFSAFSPSALKTRLQDTKAKILITADGYYRRGKLINLKESADKGIEETEVEKVIVVKRADNEINFKEGRDFWWSEITKEESDQCPAEIMDSEDILFILAESGTTGEYLQILHTIGGYTVQAYFSGRWAFDFQENDILWCTADVGWITGHTYTIYSPLLNGITTLIFEGAPDWPEKDRVYQILEKYKVTIFYTAPTLIRMLESFGSELIDKHNLSTLRILASTGEKLDEKSWMFLYEKIGKKRCPILDTWWQTETGSVVITSLPGIGPFKPGFVGLPFPGTRLDILNDEGKPCPPGKPGNLVLLSPFVPGLLRGIYRDPKKYLETYWSQYGDKIYFTGDGALKDENGLIKIVGRVDDIIKVAGHRISTGELEAAINLLSDITECAVVGIPDKIKGEIPVAFVVYKGSKTIEEIKKEVVDQVKKEIGPIVLIKEVYLVEDLPKTRSGKIMRRVLKALLKGEGLGDLSTLANPESIEEVKEAIKRKEKGSFVVFLDILFIIFGLVLLIGAILSHKSLLKQIISFLFK